MYKKMKEKEIMALADENVMNTYKRFPIVLVKGSGVKVWDVNGKEYLDFVAGIAVCNLGHSHPQVIATVKEQLENLTHVSNLYYTEPQAQLAKLLVDNSFCRINLSSKVLSLLSMAINSRRSSVNREYTLSRFFPGSDSVIAA